MRELGLVGVIALVFGLGSYYATDHFGAFSAINLVGGGGALLVGAIGGLHRLRFAGGPHTRHTVGRGLLLILAALALGVGLERAADVSELRFDWTFEESFEPAPVTVELLEGMRGELRASLFYDPLDPRVRRTRLLLQTLARHGDLEVRELDLDGSPEDVDRLEVGTSNTVVLERGSRFVTIERPTEGAIYEALYQLRAVASGKVVLLRGEGEGDPARSDELGYSGLASALATEGYELHSVVSAAMREVPEGTTLVLAIAPRRRLLDGALEALRRYLDRGGRLVALLEPGLESGLTEILADWGIRSPNALVVDPASGRVEADGIEGLEIVAYNYEVSAITRGLNRNRMTYFPGVRPLLLRKPRPEDDLSRMVLSSPRGWITEDLGWLARRTGRPEPAGADAHYVTLVAAGRYPREAGETRLVVFGDAGFASNRYLRALYNLDVILNSVHWAAEQEPKITLRPKIRQSIHFPVPLNNSVRALYGVGLLLPELLLVAGGIVWLRRRNA